MNESDLDVAAERFSQALLQPLADVGALLARAIDELNEQVEALKAELAEARSDLRVHVSEYHYRDV